MDLLTLLLFNVSARGLRVLRTSHFFLGDPQRKVSRSLPERDEEVETGKYPL